MNPFFFSKLHQLQFSDRSKLQKQPGFLRNEKITSSRFNQAMKDTFIEDDALKTSIEN